MKPLFFALFLGLVGALPAEARVYLDYEAEPLPLIEVTALLPVGFETQDPSEAGVANLLSEIVEAGTAKLDRQEYLERLGDFGANMSFSVANLHSVWSLSFPVVEGKNYDELSALLADNWAHPRFEKETFNTALQKTVAALQISLDQDMSLGRSTVQRAAKKRDWNGYPLTLESLAAVKLEAVKKVFARDFQKVPEIWVGVVAPKEEMERVKKLIAQVFPAQANEIIVGEHLQKLPLRELQPKTQDKAPPKTFVIIDKPERNQTVTTFMAASKNPLAQADELPFFFGEHIFFEAGPGAIFFDEIRTKGGFSYAVGSGGKNFLNHPMISLVTNPLRPKTDEAFKKIAQLMKESFESPMLLNSLPGKAWQRQLRSFQYRRILDRATPSARLGERMSVVLGQQSPALYKSNPASWKVSQASVAKTLNGIWKSSNLWMGAVGDAKELMPLVKKHFSDFQVVVLPYQETIKASGMARF